ncbi:uncharacterized protein LOC124421008 [Lucilia cuprina]|uniref:uncharacterized protein LOC124421008 n=1 Tax=Lucilia cuprina TaxID=7375 RepID=UPI001F06D746|nr:uncharacterized protein LOC124421008 [Lucilia cuprina]
MILRPYCCSHYKSGIIIGGIYITTNVILFILNVYLLINRSEDIKHRRRFILATVEICLCLVSVLISGLYIVAIKKNYHTFMRPGLIPYIFDFYYSSKFLFILCLKAERNNASDVNMSTTILYILCLWVIGIQMAVFWTSYILYNQIRNHNLGKSKTHKLPMTK